MSEDPQRDRETFGRDSLIRNYNTLYASGRAEDSPKKSRIDIESAILSGLREDRIEPRRILNLGSGPQQIEHELRQLFRSPEDVELLGSAMFVTTDIADIARSHLRAKTAENVSHVRADGVQLPFANESFGMVVSNMAIDLMPRRVLKSVAAILVPEGIFAFTLHHPTMMHELLEESESRMVKMFIKNWLRQGMAFERPDEIGKVFAENGLYVDSVENRRPAFLALDRSRWWLVKGKKSDAPSDKAS